MRAPRKSNNTYDDKVRLRLTALSLLDDPPVVMEAYGGIGDVFAAVYTHVAEGVVFEKNPSYAITLALQRPSWAVYETDCVMALQRGAGNHLEVNLLDVDPFGDPWPSINAFFTSTRPRARRLIIVVNDGLRHKARGGGSWDCATLEAIVARIGNHNVWSHYLEACEWLMQQACSQAGYDLAFFDGYYTGVERKMTHYLARLEQRP